MALGCSFVNASSQVPLLGSAQRSPSESGPDFSEGKVRLIVGFFKLHHLLRHLRSSVSYWLDRVNNQTVALRLHYGGRPTTDYVEAVAQQYLHSNKEDDISKHLRIVSKHQSLFRRFEAEILQADGVGEGLEKAERMSREVTQVIVWLEELLCQAMVGLLSFQAQYLAKRYMYQNP